MLYRLREARFSSAVMGGVGPNSNSIFNGIVISKPEDLGVSPGEVVSSVRAIGSESVPAEAEEEGSLGPPPKRPLILSKNELVRDPQGFDSISISRL